MDRRLRIDILKTKHVLVFINHGAGYLPADDLAKKTIRRTIHKSLPVRGRRALQADAGGGSAAVLASFAFNAFSASWAM